MIDVVTPPMPVLTIAIPTWNRHEYLRQNLRQLKSEIETVGQQLVEILVSDNCSTDATSDVVREEQAAGTAIRYVRNSENLGWARNFAQCVDMASGKFMLLLGDDDVLCTGALRLLLEHLMSADHGVVCMRPYGYDIDFERENPGGNSGKILCFKDPCSFLIRISQYFTLTSTLVINRTLLKDVDSRQFIHTNLATFHLVLRAALAAPTNLYLNKFLMASKRQNSFSYEYHKVFVGEFWEIIDAHVAKGFRPDAVRRLETKRLFTYYPFYMLDMRVSGRGDVRGAFHALKKRFGNRILFWLWIAPILRMPRPLALAWGGVTMTVGRLANGDLLRGVMFFRNKLKTSLLKYKNTAI